MSMANKRSITFSKVSIPGVNATKTNLYIIKVPVYNKSNEEIIFQNLIKFPSG